jgi:hypothetical protein
MEFLALGLLGVFLVGGLILLGQMIRDPRRQDEVARGGGPGLVALLQAAGARARRNLLGLRQEAR